MTRFNFLHVGNKYVSRSALLMNLTCHELQLRERRQPSLGSLGQFYYSQFPGLLGSLGRKYASLLAISGDTRQPVELPRHITC